MPVRLSPAGAPTLRMSPSSLDTVITREVEAVRRAVVETRFPHDPMLGAMSQIASLVRRHGLACATILAKAIDILAEGRLEVLTELSVPLTRLAHELVRANAAGRIDRIDLPPEGVFDSMYRADAVVISEELGTAWIVEIKRYNASYGRKHLKALQRLEVARLAATPILRGAYRIADVQCVLVSLYGDTTHPGVITRDGIDQFFGLELQSVLDRLDQAYAAMAAQVLNGRVRSDLALVGRDEIGSRGGSGRSSYGPAGDDGDAGATAAGVGLDAAATGLPNRMSLRPADLFRARVRCSETGGRVQ